MKIPPRVLWPIVGALLVVVVLLLFLFSELEGARAFLMDALSRTQSGSELTGTRSLTALDRQDDDKSLLHLRKGDIAALRGEWAEAAEEYESAVNAGGSTTALRKLTNAYIQRRDYRQAQATLDKLKRASGKEGDILLLETSLHIRSGDISKARQLLEAAEDSPQKHYGLALLSIIARDHVNAQTELNVVQTGWDPIARSYAQVLLGAYDEYSLFPDSPEIHLMTLLGRALAQVQECELALPLLSGVTTEQDDYRDAWIVQGFCELSTERFREALASLERAYQIDPEKAEVQYFLARAYIKLDDHPNALTFLQYALRNGFTPEEEVRTLIASEAIALGNATLALEQYDILVGSGEASIDTYARYVAAALAADKKQEALVRAEEATKKWPEDAVAFELLGEVQASLGYATDARESLEKALSLSPNSARAQELLNSL